MKKCLPLILLILIAGAFAVTLRYLDYPAELKPVVMRSLSRNTSPINNDSQTALPKNMTTSPFLPPLARAGERVTKKPFGIFITPENSPIQPERFRGYHTGSDFEVFPEELKTDITVSAVCAGSIIQRGNVNGYGGVIAQLCQLNGESITVLYGHLRLTSITLNVGDSVQQGEDLGVLGTDKSTETDGERKHLHLAFHKGSALSVKGYVATAAELSDWIDPCQYICLDP